jgi:hypothetical protein
LSPTVKGRRLNLGDQETDRRVGVDVFQDLRAEHELAARRHALLEDGAEIDRLAPGASRLLRGGLHGAAIHEVGRSRQTEIGLHGRTDLCGVDT